MPKKDQKVLMMFFWKNRKMTENVIFLMNYIFRNQVNFDVFFTISCLLDSSESILYTKSFQFGCFCVEIDKNNSTKFAENLWKF